MGENTIYIEFSIDQASKQRALDTIDYMGERSNQVGEGMGARLTKQFEQSGKSIKDVEKYITGLQQIVSNPVELGMMRQSDVSDIKAHTEQCRNIINQGLGGASKDVRAKFIGLNQNIGSVMKEMSANLFSNQDFIDRYMHDIEKSARDVITRAQKEIVDVATGKQISPETRTKTQGEIRDLTGMLGKGMKDFEELGGHVGKETKKTFTDLVSVAMNYRRVVDQSIKQFSTSEIDNMLSKAQAQMTTMTAGGQIAPKDQRQMKEDLAGIVRQYEELRIAKGSLTDTEVMGYNKSKTALQSYVRMLDQDFGKKFASRLKETQALTAKMQTGGTVSEEEINKNINSLQRLRGELTKTADTNGRLTDGQQQAYNKLTNVTSQFMRTQQDYQENITKNQLNAANAMLSRSRSGTQYSEKELKGMLGSVSAIDEKFRSMADTNTPLTPTQQNQWRISRQVVNEFSQELRNVDIAARKVSTIELDKMLATSKQQRTTMATGGQVSEAEQQKTLQALNGQLGMYDKLRTENGSLSAAQSSLYSNLQSETVAYARTVEQSLGHKVANELKNINALTARMASGEVVSVKKIDDADKRLKSMGSTYRELINSGVQFSEGTMKGFKEYESANAKFANMQKAYMVNLTDNQLNTAKSMMTGMRTGAFYSEKELQATLVGLKAIDDQFGTHTKLDQIQQKQWDKSRQILKEFTQEMYNYERQAKKASGIEFDKATAMAQSQITDMTAGGYVSESDRKKMIQDLEKEIRVKEKLRDSGEQWTEADISGLRQRQALLSTYARTAENYEKKIAKITSDNALSKYNEHMNQMAVGKQIDPQEQQQMMGYLQKRVDGFNQLREAEGGLTDAQRSGAREAEGAYRTYARAVDQTLGNTFANQTRNAEAMIAKMQTGGKVTEKELEATGKSLTELQKGYGQAMQSGENFSEGTLRGFTRLNSTTAKFVAAQKAYLVNLTDNQLNAAKSMVSGMRTGTVYDKKDIEATLTGLRSINSQFTKMHESGTQLNATQQAQWGRSQQVMKDLAGEMRNIERQQGFMNSGFAKFSIAMSGIAATIFVLQNIAAGIRAIITPFMELESSMVVTERRMGLVGDQADKLKKLLTAPGALGYGGASKITQEFNELVVAGWKVDEAFEIINGNMIQRTAELEGTVQSSVEKMQKWWHDLKISIADVAASQLIDKPKELNSHMDAIKKQGEGARKLRQELDQIEGKIENLISAGISQNDWDKVEKDLAELREQKVEIEVKLKLEQDALKNLAFDLPKNAKPNVKTFKVPQDTTSEYGIALANWKTNTDKFKVMERELSFSTPIRKTVADFDKMLGEVFTIATKRNDGFIIDLATKVHNAWKLKNVRVPLWKDLEEQTGYSTKEYSAYKKEQAKASYEWYLDFLDKEFADILVAEEKFVSRQKKLAPLMDIWNQVYKRKGIKPDAMIANEIKVAQHAIDKAVNSKLLTPEEGKAEKAAVSDEIKYQQQMDHLKRIEDVFKQTGIMTDKHYNLQKLKDDKYMHDYGNEMTTVIKQVTQAKLTAARDMNLIKGPLEDEVELYNMLGIATDEYVRLLERKRNIQNEVDKANPSTAPYAEELDAERAWLNDQATIKAKMDAYSTLYSSTKHMSQEYYDNEIKLAQHAAKNIVKLTGEIGLANEHIARRQLELDAMRLHSSDDYMEGMKVALREVEMEHKSAAERTADFWRDAHQAMGDSFTDLFYDVLMWEMDSLEDYARAFISSIAQSMANQFGDITSNGLNSLINMGVEMLGFGSPAAAATGGSSSAFDISGFSLGVANPFSTGHTGGIAGSATFGSGATTNVDPSIFFNAPRFHSGLKPDEFPAILQRGEEVVPRDKVGAKQDGDKVKIINVLDPSVVGNYLSTTAGERLIVNYMQRNKRVLT